MSVTPIFSKKNRNCDSAADKIHRFSPKLSLTSISGDDSRAPSMCLVCGEVVCSQSYCCQAELDGEAVGACTAHAHTCGARVGIFLRYLPYRYNTEIAGVLYTAVDPDPDPHSFGFSGSISRMRIQIQELRN
jgi:hypothetical protein